MINAKQTFQHPQRQQGAALVVGLVLLVVVTLLGLASMRSAALQERMSGVLLDQNRAFQAGESALRAGEDALAAVAVPDFSAAGWHSQASGSVPDWEANPHVTGSSGAILYDKSKIGVDINPQYFIEQLPPVYLEEDSDSLALGDGTTLDPIDVYRVVSRGFGNNPDSVVVLESIYRR